MKSNRRLSVVLCCAASFFSVSALGQSAPEHHVWQDSREFQPFSTTARAITGVIRLSGNPSFASVGSKMVMTFANGVKVDLTSAGASWRRWDLSSQDRVTAEVFRMSRDPGTLEQGNTLCAPDKPAMYLVFSEQQLLGGGSVLGMSVFDSEDPPHDIGSPGLCGGFSYTIK